jgi:hypothetical protein
MLTHDKIRKDHKQKNERMGRHPRETLLRVPNAALRERYEEIVGRGLMTASEVAVAAGFTETRRDGRHRADLRRLKKRLGLEPESTRKIGPDGKRLSYLADKVDYETAVRLCRAMGIEYPAEVGV